MNGLSEAIQQLLMNPEKRFMMGQAGHDYAQKNFRLEKVAQQTFDFYQDIFEKEHNKDE